MTVSVRGAIGSAAAVTTVVLGALVAPGVVGLAQQASAAPERWAPAATAALHPGVLTETARGGTCTANFVFVDDGRVLLGQAAHCAGTGEATETNGCTAGTAGLNAQVTVHGSDGRDRTGHMVYSSWVTMQSEHETDPQTCAYNDFALVELSPADAADVNPSVPFFGGPTGLHGGGLPAGTPVVTYGNSPTRLGVAALSPKAGTSTGDIGGGWAHEVYTVSPGIPGDSGSGYLTGDGAAAGILATLNLAPLPVSNNITDLPRAMSYARRHGLSGLALVRGTEPFEPNPAALLGRGGPVPAP